MVVWGGLTPDQVMTPASDLVSVGPDDSLEECGLVCACCKDLSVVCQVMSEMNITALPVVYNSDFLGVVTLEVWCIVEALSLDQNVNRYVWNTMVGGKDTFVRHVLPRKGSKHKVLSVFEQPDRPG